MATAAELKSLRISAGACKRLTKDIAFYVKETEEFRSKIDSLRAKDPEDKHALTKLIEMQDESGSALQDVKIRTHKMFEELQSLLSNLGDVDQDAVEVVEAQAVIEKCREVLDSGAADEPPVEADEQKLDGSSFDRKSVTIFGAGRSGRGHPVWNLGDKIGRLLAEAGFNIKTGGYSGTMESAAEGARSAGIDGVEVVGVPVPTMFPGVEPNPSLTKVIPTETLHERLCHLLQADAFVALPGMLGTLTEIVYVWEHAALARMHKTGNFPPIYLFKEPWLKVIEGMVETAELSKEDFDLFRWVGSSDSEIEGMIQELRAELLD